MLKVVQERRNIGRHTKKNIIKEFKDCSSGDL